METTESKAVSDSKHQGEAQQLKIPKMPFYDEIAGTFASEVVKACLLFDTKVKLGNDPYQELRILYDTGRYCVDFLSSYTKTYPRRDDESGIRRLLRLKTIYEALLLWTNRHVKVMNQRRAFGLEAGFDFRPFVDQFTLVEDWPAMFKFEAHAKALLEMDGRLELEE